MQRLSCLLLFSIIGAFALGACGDGGLFEDAKPALAPTTVAPTFVRVTVTPGPTQTPTPVVVSEPLKVFSEAELADPVFPEWLDPELTEAKPEDEVIFDGWRQFMLNTSVIINGEESGIHLCEDRVLMPWLAKEGNKANWYVTRSAAISSKQWGNVDVRMKVNAGPGEGGDHRVMQIERVDGTIRNINALLKREFEFKRSDKCLALESVVDYSKLASLADPVFPSQLDPDEYEPQLDEERPTDEDIFGGWTGYLTNASVSYDGAPTSWHLCEDGVVLNDAGFDPYRQGWFVTRSPEISEDDWGAVGVRVTVTYGRYEGREFTLLLLSRKYGGVYVTNTTSPEKVEITRSESCLAYVE